MAQHTDHDTKYNPDVLTPHDVENLYRIPRSSQKKQRALGTFAVHYRVGRRVYYRLAAVEQWIAEQEAECQASSSTFVAGAGASDS